LEKNSSIDAENRNVFREIEMFIRIHEARGVISTDGEQDEMYSVDCDGCEHYLILIVCCPLAFSLRNAVYESLQNRQKGNQDTHHVDARRCVWNMLANHLREGLYGFRDDEGKPSYAEKAIGKSLETSNIDWMRHHEMKLRTSRNVIKTSPNTCSRNHT
jgi:hypothetical protein